jgi:predicted ATP-grasp superfamily ATP-dependent carboligase
MDESTPAAPATPATTVTVVADDKKSGKRIKELELEVAKSQDVITGLTAELTGLKVIVEKATKTPAPGNVEKTLWQIVEEMTGLSDE